MPQLRHQNGHATMRFVGGLKEGASSYVAPMVLMCVLLLSLVLSFASPSQAQATQKPYEGKVVSVAVIDYPRFLQMDDNGVVSGYAYEYLQDIADVAGWTYEWKEMTFAQATADLQAGRVDIVAGSQYVESRARLYDYAARDMGMGGTVLCSRLDEDRYAYNDYESLNGACIGALTGSARTQQVADKLAESGVTATFIDYDTDEEAKAALQAGQVDMVAMSSIRCEPDYKLVARLNSQPVYFTSNPFDPEVKAGIDLAQDQILLNDPYYAFNLDEKYYGDVNTSVVFTTEERAYISAAHPLKVALVADRMPLSYLDSNGDIVGIDRDIMDRIAQLSGLEFTYEAVSVGTKASDLLNSGQADLLAGVRTTNGAQLPSDLVLSDSYLASNVVLVTKNTETAPSAEQGVIALQKGFFGAATIVDSMPPGVTILDCNTASDALRAVEDGRATCALLNSFNVSVYLRDPSFESLVISPAYTAEQNSCIACLASQDDMLLSILNKCIMRLDDSETAQAIVSYTASGSYDASFSDLVYAYRWPLGIGAVSLVVIVGLLVGLVLMRRRSEVRLAQKNADLQVAVDRATEANRAKSEFLGRMSHSMRTPLNVTVGLSWLGRHEDDAVQMHDYFDKINKSGTTLLSLVDGLLNASRHEIKSDDAPAEDASAPNWRCLQGHRVLVVDDYSVNRQIAAKVLENVGMEVVCAVDGKDCVSKFLASCPEYYSVVLMDVRMPNMNGLEAARCLRSLDRVDAQSVVIIALSANAYEEDIANSLAVGMDEHLAKPLDPEALYAVLARYLG